MSNDIARRGLMLVLSSPSGAGKTTLSRRLLADDAAITMSVSATTRAPRVGEIEGKDYYFVSPSMFGQMAAGNGFLEHATVFANQYGTPIEPVQLALAFVKSRPFVGRHESLPGASISRRAIRQRVPYSRLAGLSRP